MQPATGQPALLGIGRLNNFRLAYLPAALDDRRQAWVGITLDGVPVRVHYKSVTIRDVLNDEPNTCALTIDQLPPPQTAQTLRVVLGVDPKRTLFSGTLQAVNESYVGVPPHRVFPCTALDDTPRANRRIPLGQWTDTSATTVAQWLIATFAPGFTATHVQAGLPLVSVLFDGSEAGMNGCLRQLSKLVGGYFYWEDRDLHFFQTEPADTPDPIDTTPCRILDDPPIRLTSQDSQIRTRVYGKGYGESVLSAVAAGETRIPVGSVVMFNPTGGKVISESQVLGFTGVQVGGGGALVGPGAAPVAGPALALAAGTGVESGAHDYAVTFITAAGESIAGPRTSITTGPVPGPVTAPVPQSVSPGGGVNAGSHDYAVTFTAGAGETSGGPISPAIVTGGAAASPPATAPTAGAPTAGGLIDAGAHYYAASFLGATGETPAGPVSNTITTGMVAAPTAVPVPTLTGAGNIVAGSYNYKTTFVTAAGETTPSDGGTVNIDPLPDPGGTGPLNATTGGGLTPGATYGYQQSYIAAGGAERLGSTSGSVFVGAPNNAVLMAAIGTSADPRVTGRRIYRVNFSIGQWRLVGTINNNTATSFLDTMSDATAAGQPAAPSGNTPYSGQVSVSNIAVGPAGVTARKVYRTTVSGSTYLLLATINNNSTTTFTDNSPDGALGAAAPIANTAINQTVHLSGIPTGPAGTTARNVYRTAANGSQLKLLNTLGNNSTTTLTDNNPDSTLGVNAPTAGATLSTVNIAGIPTGSPSVSGRKLYRRFNGAGLFYNVGTIADNVTTVFTDTLANVSVGPPMPGTNTATANQVALSGIPTGAAAVTGRKIYRTTAGGTQLKLWAFLADNTTRAATDASPDATLGVNVPTADTSGLVQPEGQMPAGSTALLVASAAAFDPAGGWVIIGNGQQVIRYTGITGQTLTGVPPSGVGAITATVGYNSTATSAAALIGVTGLTRALIKGAPVNIWVQRDDVAAQAALAARDGSDGIVEHRVVDERRNADSLIDVCDADLQQFSRPLVTVTYATRDVKTKSGKTITVNLPALGMVHTLTIQDVSITEIGLTPTLAPKFTVTASSMRFSIEDILRRLTTRALSGV